MKLEKDARIYIASSKSDYKLFLLVKDQINTWHFLSYGWESDLYRVIGKRAAAVENGHLQVSSIIKQTIESYVSYYEGKISNPLSFNMIYEDFLVKIRIDLTKLKSYQLTRFKDLLDKYSFCMVEDNVYELENPPVELLLVYGMEKEFIEITTIKDESLSSEEWSIVEEQGLLYSNQAKQLELF